MNVAIDMLQLGVRNECLRNHAKVVIMFGEGMKDAVKNCGDVDCEPCANILVHVRYKM